MAEHGKTLPQALGGVRLIDLRHALSGKGLWLDVGSAVVRVRSSSLHLADQLQRAYCAFPFTPDGHWADEHVDIRPSGGLRRWIKPQISFWCDGSAPFEPFPSDNALPLFEWGCNWLIGQRTNHLLLLHAGAVERNGLALVMPAVPGAGKSTLTAALAMRGWRLLSDEFGAFDPASGNFRAMLKPVALKNQSIDVIRRFAPNATFGPVFPNTHKGDVSHLAALPDAVARRHEIAAPGAFLLPKWQAGSATRLEPLSENRLFPALAFNAFNYGVLGSTAFHAVVELVRKCPGWQLVYSDLDDAVAAIERLWPQVQERHAGRGK